MKLFIAQTLDGFIAGPNDSLDHLQPFHGVDFGYEGHVATVDAVVLGRRTFDAVFPKYGWTYPPHLPGVVLTRRPLPEGTPAQVSTATDLTEIARRHPDAYVDGGAETIRGFLEIGAIDEMRIFTLPIFLGQGVRLFPEGASLAGAWTLEAVRAHPENVVEAHYRATRRTVA